MLRLKIIKLKILLCAVLLPVCELSKNKWSHGQPGCNVRLSVNFLVICTLKVRFGHRFVVVHWKTASLFLVVKADRTTVTWHAGCHYIKINIEFIQCCLCTCLFENSNFMPQICFMTWFSI